MKEHKKTTGLNCLTEINFWRIFLTIIFRFFGGFLNHILNRRRTRLLCCRRTLLARGKNTFCAGDERFSAGHECFSFGQLHCKNVLKASAETSAPHSCTCSYERLSDRTSVEIATHRYSPSQTGGIVWPRPPL